MSWKSSTFINRCCFWISRAFFLYVGLEFQICLGEIHLYDFENLLYYYLFLMHIDKHESYHFKNPVSWKSSTLINMCFCWFHERFLWRWLTISNLSWCNPPIRFWKPTSISTNHIRSEISCPGNHQHASTVFVLISKTCSFTLA